MWGVFLWRARASHRIIRGAMTKLIFHNQHFLIALKPAGVLTVPDRDGVDSARPVLGLQLQDELGVRLFPVHRLDLPVAGLVLFALDPEAHKIANTWFETRRVHKTYRAWTHAQSFAHIPAHVGNSRHAITPVNDMHFEWRGRIDRNKRRAFENPRGKPSLTLAQYLGRHPAHGYLMWDVAPVTGRPHQLRLDLSRHGFPIIGDRLYGSSMDFGPERIALKAFRLDFSVIVETERLGLPELVQIDPEL